MAKRDGSWDQLGRRFSTFATHGPVVALAPARRSSGRTSGKDRTSGIAGIAYTYQILSGWWLTYPSEK